MGKFSRLGNALYEGDVSVDFVGRRWLWYSISLLIVFLAVGGLYFKGLNMGIEFEGGAEFRVSLPADQVNQSSVETIRNAIVETGIPDAAAPTVNTSGAESIRVQTLPLDDAEGTQVADAITTAMGIAEADLSQSEIGATWGEQVADRALIGLLVFLVLVVLFIWAYFRQWKMSVAALVALAHDLVITVGVYALSGFEVTPATVTGLLTILGFSLYDTVVVFDKVRENTKDLSRSHLTYSEAANLAVNQTLVRSINTSIVALLPVGAILYVGVTSLGSGSLKDLALALFVGMAAGVYSSVFIATPLLVQLKRREKDVQGAESRAQARRRHADRYDAVPVFAGEVAPGSEPTATGAPGQSREHGATALRAPARSLGRQEATGSGRTVPAPRSPVRQSGAAKRAQPSRQPRSKRGKR